MRTGKLVLFSLSPVFSTTVAGVQTLIVKQSSLIPAAPIINSGSSVRSMAGWTEMYCQHEGGIVVALTKVAELFDEGWYA